MRRTVAVLAGLWSAAFQAASAQEAVPPKLDFVFEENVTLAAGVPLGNTPLGGRYVVPITGGRFSGERLRGEVLPGGWDWQLVRSDGCLQIVADYFLKTDDGVVIKVHNTGVACPPKDGVAPPIRTHPVFEAPEGKYGWLNREMFLGALEPSQDNAVRLRFYMVR